MSGKKIPLSDKKKVETAASAEAIEKVKHSTLGTLVHDLLDPLLAKTHFAPTIRVLLIGGVIRLLSEKSENDQVD